MITELQTSYDSLLQRYAAAENALDKVELELSKLPDWIFIQVRLGGKPHLDWEAGQVAGGAGGGGAGQLAICKPEQADRAERRAALQNQVCSISVVSLLSH